MATPAVDARLIHQEPVDFQNLKAVAEAALLASERSSLTGLPIPANVIQHYTMTFNPYIMYGLLVLFEKTLKLDPDVIHLVPKPSEPRDADTEN